jgi:hypothetical protein
MRVLRSRATELEREFPFGIVRQPFEPTALDVAHRAGAAQLAGRAETELRVTGARPRRASSEGSTH